MKRIISVILSVSILCASIPVFAYDNINELKILSSEVKLLHGDKEGKIESIVFNNGDKAEFYSYQENGLDIIEVKENGLEVTMIEFDRKNNDILINGQSIIIDTYQNEFFTSAYDNWGSPSISRRSAWVEGLSASVLTALILGLFTGPVSGVVAAVSIILERCLDTIYFESVCYYNYVDYGWKVGYRLTETLYRNSNYTGQLCSRYMSGSR